MNLKTPPTVEQLQAELKRSRYKRSYQAALRGTLWVLILVAVAALAFSFRILSVMQVNGSAMSPLMQDGDIVVALKGGDIHKGDIAAFYYNDKLLIKRVIAEGGDEISIFPNGSISLNGITLAEPYVSEPALGECDISFPYHVPDQRLFVLGDQRAASLDSRHSAIGCVAEEQLVGRVVLRIWPFKRIALIGEAP